MNTSMNKQANDPIDLLIFEKKLRVKHFVADKRLDLIVIILSNGGVVKVKLSDFKRLAKASQAQLDKGEIADNGVALSWPALDEDLSVKGLIKSAFYNNLANSLDAKGEFLIN